MGSSRPYTGTADRMSACCLCVVFDTLVYDEGQKHLCINSFRIYHCIANLIGQKVQRQKKFERVTKQKRRERDRGSESEGKRE